jgi:hypothetical protein
MIELHLIWWRCRCDISINVPVVILGYPIALWTIRFCSMYGGNWKVKGNWFKLINSIKCCTSNFYIHLFSWKLLKMLL